jgi:polygalacturonase
MARGYTSKPEKLCAIEFKNCNNITVEGIGLRAGGMVANLISALQQRGSQLDALA